LRVVRYVLFHSRLLQGLRVVPFFVCFTLAC
jgi:hypothetical protein